MKPIYSENSSKNRTLYRYIDFEKFVCMMQKQTLTLVLPEKWDDPTDKTAFDRVEKRTDEKYFKVSLNIEKNNTYCMCWTKQYQSDAMWRIYAFNNHAVRIKVKEDDLIGLDKDLKLRDVIYSNVPMALRTRC